MIKGLGQLMKQLKSKLPEYLESQGIKTTGRLFSCPNKEEHRHGDLKPSANFYPDRSSFHCFACSYKNKLGDIFDAVHLLEKKDITGENFMEVVKYLCTKFHIPYEEVSSEEEDFLKEVRAYLEQLVSTAYHNLQTNKANYPLANDLLVKKSWMQSVDAFKLGFLNTPYASPTNKDIPAYLNLDPKLLVDRLLIPIHDSHGRIAGVTARLLNNETKSSDFKYKHFIMCNLKRLLYNAHNIDATKEVIVVEGPSSVLTLNTFGINNVVATFGNLMHDNQYEILVKKKVKKILFLYDGDAGGLEGLRNSLPVLCRGDIEVRIGLLEGDLDPADYVVKNKNLNQVRTMSLLTYLSDNYASNTDDKLIEKNLMMYVNSIGDLVRKENIVNQIAKTLKINKSTIQDLLKIYGGDTNVSVSQILKERDSLATALTEYEKWTWSRGQLLGLKSFKTFDMKLDGLQNGFVLIGGRPNIGKSAFLISLVLNILRQNQDVYLLYFTIDDSLYTTISRFIANQAELPINIVSNPNFKIAKAELPPHVKNDYINRREKALTFLRQNSSFINLKDTSEGSTIEQIEETMANVAPLAQGKQLIVVIDSVHNLRSSKRLGERQLYEYISNKLNNLSNTYKCPIVASAHITKDAIKNKSYDGTAFKETVEFFFDAKLMIIVDTDDDELEDRDDLNLKVIIAKNKMSAFKGSLDMVFYKSFSQVREVFTTAKQDEKKLFE